MDGLTVGRIVHYVTEDGAHLPAIIVEVCHFPESNADSAVCNLKIFTNKKGKDKWIPNVPFAPARGWGNTWHWVERE